jgi:hypothetical protein
LVAERAQAPPSSPTAPELLLLDPLLLPPLLDPLPPPELPLPPLDPPLPPLDPAPLLELPPGAPPLDPLLLPVGLLASPSQLLLVVLEEPQATSERPNAKITAATLVTVFVRARRPWVLSLISSLRWGRGKQPSKVMGSGAVGSVLCSPGKTLRVVKRLHWKHPVNSAPPVGGVRVYPGEPSARLFRFGAQSSEPSANSFGLSANPSKPSANLLRLGAEPSDQSANPFSLDAHSTEPSANQFGLSANHSDPGDNKTFLSADASKPSANSLGIERQPKQAKRQLR